MVHARARHGKQFTLSVGSTFIRRNAMSQSWFKKKANALELYTIDVILGRRADTGAAIGCPALSDPNTYTSCNG